MVHVRPTSQLHLTSSSVFYNHYNIIKTSHRTCKIYPSIRSSLPLLTFHSCRAGSVHIPLHPNISKPIIRSYFTLLPIFTALLTTSFTILPSPSLITNYICISMQHMCAYYVTVAFHRCLSLESLQLHSFSG